MTGLIAASRRTLLRLWHVVRPEHGELELARELEAHLALLEDELRGRGLSPEEARLAARRRLGGIEHAKALHRQARSFVWMDDARRDAGQMLRSLNRHRGFAVVAILTLAIGIGANTVLFSAFNAVVLRPLPYRSPNELVVISPPVFQITSARAFQTLRENSRQLRAFAGFIGPGAATLLDRGTPAGVDYADVTWNFLSFLNTRPAIGRDFTEADSRPGAARVAVLTHDLWQRRFNADRSIVGRTIMLNDGPVTIVGVTSSTFRFPVTGLRPATGIVDDLQPGLLRVALASQPMNVIGRLAPGATPTSAAAELWPIYRDTDLSRVSKTLTADAHVVVVPLHERLAGALRHWLLLVMATVALVLLVAAANVANLLLARAWSRHRELAIRTAVGAPLGRLVRMTLTESVVLAMLGATVALLLTWLAASAVRPLLADRMPHVRDIDVDWAVFAFNAALAIVTGLLCGLASLSAVRRIDVASAFNEGGAPSMSGRTRTRQMLLSAEAGFTFVLVLGAILVVQTFFNLETRERGFDARNVLTVRVTPGPAWIASARDLPAAVASLAVYTDRVVDRITALPGVSSAALVSNAPLGPLGFGFTGVTVQGYAAPAEREVSVLFVTPRYFETMRTPILAGREFRTSDSAASAPVVIVNKAFERRFAAGQALVGATVVADDRQLTIVGTAANVPASSLRDDVQPMMYVPLTQSAALRMLSAQMTMVVRTREVPPAALIADVRRAVWSVDTSVVLADVTSLEERVANSLRTERQTAAVFSSVATIALLIAAIGVYGVATYSMVQRTKELGIRIALGADHQDVLWLLLRQAAIPTFAGMAIAVPVAGASTRLLGSLLYGVTALDPRAFIAAAAVLTLAALAASIGPARKVLQLDPVEALRTE